MKHTRKIRKNSKYFREMQRIDNYTMHCQGFSSKNGDISTRANNQHGQFTATSNISSSNSSNYYSNNISSSQV